MSLSPRELARHGYEIESAVVSAMPISMACWGQADDVTNIHTLVSLVDPADNSHNIQLQMDGSIAGDRVTANTQDGGVRARGESTAAFVAGRWYHCGAVFTGAGGNVTSRTAYLDGIAGTADTTSHTPLSLGRTTVALLHGSAFAEELRGSAVWPAIWSSALTAADFAKLALGWHPWQIDRANLVVAPLFHETFISPHLTLVDPISGDTWTESLLASPVGAAGSWSAGIATLTLLALPGTWAVGKLIRVSGVTPSGYDTPLSVITAIAGLDVSYELTDDPGAFTSGGSVALRMSRGTNPIQISVDLELLYS